MNTDTDKNPLKFKNNHKVLASGVLVASLIFFLITYLILFSNSFRGLDITDEGMYLLSVNHVSESMSFHNPFGDYTGLLYQLSAQKVWGFRILGIALLGLSGLYLSFSVRNFTSENITAPTKLALILSGLLIAPHYYALGILTPSYNWLNISTITLGLGSILNLTKNSTASSKWLVLHTLMLATSIWIGTFAKASTGLGLLLLFLISKVIFSPRSKEITHQFSWVLGFLISFAVLHHLFISPIGLAIEKTLRGHEALRILDPLYNTSAALTNFFYGIVQWLEFFIRNLFFHVIVFVLLLALVASLRLILQRHLEFPIRQSLIVLPLLTGLDSLLNGNWAGVVGRYNQQMWSVTRLFVIVFFFCVLLGTSRGLALSRLTSLCILLLSGNVLYAFGSNNGFVNQITGSTGLIAVSALLLSTALRKYRAFLVLPLTLILSCGALVVTLNASRQPYRQAPMSVQTTRIEISNGAGRVYLNNELAAEIEDLRSQLKSSNWAPRTPLLDFTSYSAGIVFALDAEAPITVLPTVGNAPGANSLAEWSLKYIRDNDSKGKWRDAWILMPSEEAAQRCVYCPDTDALQILKRSFPNDYDKIAETFNFRIYSPRD
jgi:hypothetical protein